MLSTGLFDVYNYDPNYKYCARRSCEQRVCVSRLNYNQHSGQQLKHNRIEQVDRSLESDYRQSEAKIEQNLYPGSGLKRTHTRAHTITVSGLIEWQTNQVNGYRHSS